MLINKTMLLMALAAPTAAIAMGNELNDSTTLNDVVVTGTRNATDVRHLPMTVTVIDRATLTEANNPSILPTVMQRIPGMIVTARSMKGYGVSSGGSGNINMRGIAAGSGQMMVLIDGHPQYNGIYSHPIADSYQTMIADRVEILRGPASVIYGGGAMGGVLNIVTRKMTTDGMKTSVNIGAGSYGTIEAEATNQLKKGAFSSTVSGQYSRSDNHVPNMFFEQYGGHIKLGYDINRNWNTYINANVTHFNAQHPGTTTEPRYGAYQWITRGEVSVALANNYENTSGAISIFSNFGRHKIDDGSKKAGVETTEYFRSKDALSGISLYQSISLFEGNRITAGADYMHIYGNAYYTSKATGEILTNKGKSSGRSYRNEVAGYVELRQDIASWLTIDGGIRVDHHSVSGTEWIPQGGLVIRPSDDMQLKLMASKGYRNPSMRELYLYPPSNEELEPEKLWNYEISWNHKFGGFYYGANFFYVRGTNMIQTVARKNVNTGRIENHGVETELGCEINKNWSVHTNHSYLFMTNPVVAAPEYKGVLGVNYHDKAFHCGINAQYITNMYTELGNPANKENFWLLDVNASYTLSPLVTLWVRGENLLGESYEINKGYPMPGATAMAGVKLSF